MSSHDVASMVCLALAPGFTPRTPRADGQVSTTAAAAAAAAATAVIRSSMHLIDVEEEEDGGFAAPYTPSPEAAPVRRPTGAGGEPRPRVATPPTPVFSVEEEEQGAQEEEADDYEEEARDGAYEEEQRDSVYEGVSQEEEGEISREESAEVGAGRCCLPGRPTHVEPSFFE
jgi:hypothetical protein